MKTRLDLIGLAGQKQNGKSSLAKYLASQLTKKIPIPCHAGVRYEDAPWGQGSFAGAVKRIFCETFQKDLAFIEEWKVKNECPPGFDKPVREALTFIGDGFRKIKSDVWIENFFHPENDPFFKVVDDLRYLNEASAIRQIGGVTILLYRENNINWDANRSEAELRPYLLWCRAVDKEGIITEWDEFKQKKFNNVFASDQDRENFWVSLPEEHFKPPFEDNKFFENLSLFDLFTHAADGVENIHHKVDSIVLPYLRENYLLN